MHNSSEEIWGFLGQSDVKKIRRIGDEFEFLLPGPIVVKPRAFFDNLNREISKARPEKIVVGRNVLRKRTSNRTRWVSSIDSPSSTFKMEVIKGFRTEDDKAQDEVCNARARELNIWWEDLQALFTLIRFGDEKIPRGLAVANQSEEIKMPSLAYFSLGTMSRIDREAFYPIVVQDLMEMYNSGEQNSWEEVFANLSRESQRKYRRYLKGKMLSPGQIKGIYTNNTRFTKNLK